MLRKRMEECVDGEYQDFKSKNGAYVREHFFGKYPETAELVKDWSDEDIWELRRGGHDPLEGLCGVCRRGEAHGATDRDPCQDREGLRHGRGRRRPDDHAPAEEDGCSRPCASFAIASRSRSRDDKVEEISFLTLADGSPEKKYLEEQRRKLGGPLPQRRRKSASLEVPQLGAFAAQLASTEDREISTTMAFVRILNTMLRDKALGRFVVPIVPDESRTFGMEGLFRQLGIFSQVGQLYKPQDADQLMYYREDKSGQMLQEGINEAGAMSSWIAAATSYSTSNVPMIPFYIFYSMFGMQRVGDLAWAAGDMRCRGFLLGGTAGRTTLNGEGLQHEDGHSHILASVIPNCVSYDPTFAYEVAVIIQDGLRRMFKDQEDVYYYVTLMNENYPHPAMPEGAEEGIRRGMYLFRDAGSKKKAPRVQLLGCGTILREVIAAAELLEQDFGVLADVWSCPSFNELRREGMEVERWNLLHPAQAPRKSYVEECLAPRQGPIIAATDYVRAFAEQIRPHVPRRYVCLGTDGFGRSDYRAALRTFFEVNRHYVVLAALKALADEGALPTGEDRGGDRQVPDRHGEAGSLEDVRQIGQAPEKAPPRENAQHRYRLSRAIAMGQVTQVCVPDIGDFKDVPIIEIMVAPGDRVAAEAPLVTLESDKAAMEVPSPSAGIVKSLAVKLGDKVSQGAPILLLELDGAGAAAEPAKPAVHAPPAPTSAPGGLAEVRVPDIGDFKDVPIIEVMVKPGDTIKAEQPLVTLESDKASMEVPSPLGGVVADLKVKLGDRVSAGTIILTLGTDQAAAAQAAPLHLQPRRLPPLRLPPRLRQKLQLSIFPTPGRRPASAPANSASICARSRAAARAGASCPPMSRHLRSPRLKP